MAAGVPVVGYDLPVYRRIYGNAFLKVRCFDKDDFARNIVRLLDDQSLFDDFRRRGLACAASYGWDAIAASDWDSVLVNDMKRRTE
jgi:glycosyltransferase involved in cell wall biosynthesis